MNNLDLGRNSLGIEFYSILQMKSYMHMCGIACELAKAYDCVHHEILLSKLNFMEFEVWLDSLIHTFHNGK
jgi:hypothetical protein